MVPGWRAPGHRTRGNGNRVPRRHPCQQVHRFGRVAGQEVHFASGFKPFRLEGKPGFGDIFRHEEQAGPFLGRAYDALLDRRGPVADAADAKAQVGRPQGDVA